MRQISFPQRWLIADKAFMYAEAFHAFLNAKEFDAQVEIACSKRELLDSMDDAPPDVLIIEPWCARDDSGYTDLDFLFMIRTRYPRCHLVVFTAETNLTALRRIAAMESVGLSSKADEPDDVLHVVRQVMAGRQGVTSARMTGLIAASNLLIRRNIPEFRPRTPDR